MTKSIEELLVDCASKGMTHLTVYPVHSEDRKTLYWHAKASPSTDRTGSASSGTDIVAVVTEALTEMPKVRGPKPREPDLIDRNRGTRYPEVTEAEPQPVTATVIDAPRPNYVFERPHDPDWMIKG